MLQIGYSATEVDDLHASGIAAIDLDSFAEENAFEVLGSNPINVFACDASWHLLKRKSAGDRVVLIDFYSGAAFHPVEISPFAIFGQRGLGLKVASPLPSVPPDFRWRFNSIPKFVAFTEKDMEVIGSMIQAANSNQQKLAFRGQTRQYHIYRQNNIRKLLYGSEAALEPSLLTTAFRSRFQYVTAERHWRTLIADIDYRLTGFKDKRWWVEDRYESVTVASRSGIARWHNTSTMAIAQHYGIPTYGLDVTTSIKMAWWFATHHFSSSGTIVRYTPHVWSGFDWNYWPVIYVFRIGIGPSLSKLDLPAKRPERQDAVFIKGGWGPHGNICADDLLAVIVLAPEIGAAPGEPADIFPPPLQDPMYAELLKLKERLTPDHPLFLAAGLQHVFELAYDKAGN